MSNLEVNMQDSVNAENHISGLERCVHIIRGKQVIIDSDLAVLYQTQTKNLNKAASRNEDRFPSDFRFQLTKEEYDNLRFHFGTSSLENSGHGGRRYYPYAYTEQGISMLASVLRTPVAVQVSISIMRMFVEMRRFISTNSLLFERISEIELKQLTFQQQTNEKFDKIFYYIDNHTESEQKIFFEGQIYDAFGLLVSIIQKAKTRVILIDGYVDIATLNILSKKKDGVNVCVYTYENTRLTDTDIDNFNKQYPLLSVKTTQIFHDRFIVIDDEDVYHIGASVKDAGKKCFAISLLSDTTIIADLLNRVNNI